MELSELAIIALITIVKIVLILVIMLLTVAYLALFRKKNKRVDTKPHRAEPGWLSGAASAFCRCI